MKSPARIPTGLVAALWMFLGTDVMAQGSLTPPGVPGETMKTLAQVEPRTPISSLPYTINESGSYYVTGNLSSMGDGIIIQSSGVTVDLMGFSLTGDGGPHDYGIQVNGSTNAVIENLVIKGGRISGFNDGLNCSSMNNSRIEGLVVSGNTDDGATLNGGNSGRCNGNTITNCTISENDDKGIYLYGGNGQCNGNTVANCTIGNNAGRGIDLVGTQGQCDGNTLHGNSIKGNVDRGIAIYWGDGNRVEANTIWGTTGEGATYGIRTVSTTDNLFLKNSCVGNGTNYELDPDDTFGPIVEAAGELGTADGASHPWANFSR